jgi:transposase
MIAESYVPSEELCERRVLVRGRKQLVEKRTDFKNEVHSLLDKHEISYDWDLFNVNGREILACDDFSLGMVASTAGVVSLDHPRANRSDRKT